MLKCPKVIRLFTENELDGSAFGYHCNPGVGGKMFEFQFPDPQAVLPCQGHDLRAREMPRRIILYWATTVATFTPHSPLCRSLYCHLERGHPDERPAFDTILQQVIRLHPIVRFELSVMLAMHLLE